MINASEAKALVKKAKYNHAKYAETLRAFELEIRNAAKEGESFVCASIPIEFVDRLTETMLRLGYENVTTNQTYVDGKADISVSW